MRRKPPAVTPQAKWSEHEHQSALMLWAKYTAKSHPELRLLHAIPNGGQRSPITAARLKAEGVMPGIPDLHLPVPRGRYCGLWIELKAHGGRATDNQRAVMAMLTEYGNRVALCFGMEEAKGEILNYLSLGAT